jgi:hypothetical protein
MCTGLSFFSPPEPKGLIALGIFAFHSVLFLSPTPLPSSPSLHLSAPRDPISVLLSLAFTASTPRFVSNNGSRNRNPHN